MKLSQLSRMIGSLIGSSTLSNTLTASFHYVTLGQNEIERNSVRTKNINLARITRHGSHAVVRVL